MVNRIQWTTRLVNKFWDGVAQTELDSLSFGKVAGPQFLDLISKYLVEGRTYLDFGAGSGDVLKLLLDRGLDAAGFDPSPDRHSRLLEKVGHHKNFLGVLGSDSDQQFDVVFLIEVIEHVLDEDFASVLESVSKFVKPGGYLVVSAPNNENLELSSVYCPVSDTLFHRWQHVRSFTPAKLYECFVEKGFTNDLLVLADFSSDAKMVELYKKHDAVDCLIGSASASISEFQRRLALLIGLGDNAKSEFNLNFLQKIKLIFNFLMAPRNTLLDFHYLLNDIAHQLHNISDCANELSGKSAQMKPHSNLNISEPSVRIDLRIGRETTIVYVGQKLG